MSESPADNPFAPDHADPHGATLRTSLPSASPPSLTRIEQTLERLGERLNPILVKEARQALKSNQFLITFTLLMMGGWAWSFLGVIFRMPEIRYAPSGGYMLGGYFIILVVPLFVIVPFAAFRSLAAEREDGTFELMSITMLSARQIVTGKLGSSILQMLVYFSALSPCIAFTYLLRGIDVPVIVIILAYTLGISILLSSFGLLIATLSRHRHWQVFLSVGLILLLVIVVYIWCAFVFETMLLGMQLNIAIDEPQFWGLQGALVTALGSFSLLFVQAAASRITFASDNRSTRLRATIFVQLLLYVGWFFYFLSYDFDAEACVVLIVLPAFYMAVVGAMTIGESGVLSPRVRRQLPQSFLGRMAFTWFNPGSATGYFFVVTNLLGIVLIACGVHVYGVATGKMGGWVGRNDGRVLWFGLLCWCYLTSYLGIARLLVAVARRFHIGSLALSYLLTTLVATSAIAIPLIGEGLVAGFNQINYTVIQAPNWGWTLTHCLSKGMSGHMEVVYLVSIMTFTMIVANLFLARREIGQVRVAR